jgi:uncharacterized membrane protein
MDTDINQEEKIIKPINSSMQNNLAHNALLTGQHLCSMDILNAAHWHLMLNHFPITGTLTGFLILLCSFLFRNATLMYTALVIFILTALLTIPAYLTGEGAEEILQQVVGFNAEEAIEIHEESAKTALITMQVLGALSLLSLVIYWNGKHNTARLLNAFIGFFSLIVLVLMLRVATQGGEIRHSEIRTSSSLKIFDEAKTNEQSDE